MKPVNSAMREKVPVSSLVASRDERSWAALTSEHLCRLAGLADADHALFTRPDGRPEYRSRRLAVVLAQGAALHYLHDRSGGRYSDPGVKDLDVWTFYSVIPGRRFPADKRETRADFGPSELGRQWYDLDAARNARERARWQRFSAYSGRRVDLLMRALPVQTGAPTSSVVKALQEWLEHGAQSSATRKPSPWHLARKAMVLLYPEPCRGDVVWPPGWPDE
jgi:hypothetical protein